MAQIGTVSYSRSMTTSHTMTTALSTLAALMDTRRYQSKAWLQTGTMTALTH